MTLAKCEMANAAALQGNNLHEKTVSPTSKFHHENTSSVVKIGSVRVHFTQNFKKDDYPATTSTVLRQHLEAAKRIDDRDADEGAEDEELKCCGVRWPPSRIPLAASNSNYRHTNSRICISRNTLGGGNKQQQRRNFFSAAAPQSLVPSCTSVWPQLHEVRALRPTLVSYCFGGSAKGELAGDLCKLGAAARPDANRGASECDRWCCRCCDSRAGSASSDRAPIYDAAAADGQSAKYRLIGGCCRSCATPTSSGSAGAGSTVDSASWDANSGTLDRFQKFRFGSDRSNRYGGGRRGSGGSHKKKTSSRSSDRSINLKKLTDKLKQSTASQSQDGDGSSAVAQSLEPPPPPPPPPPLPSFASQPAIQVFIPLKDDDEGNHAGAVDGEKDSDIFDGVNLKLTKPESRTIVGSYYQRSIPFRSASFSQVHYLPEDRKYIRNNSRKPGSLKRGSGNGAAAENVAATLPRTNASGCAIDPYTEQSSPHDDQFSHISDELTKSYDFAIDEQKEDEEARVIITPESVIPDAISGEIVIEKIYPEEPPKESETSSESTLADFSCQEASTVTADTNDLHESCAEITAMPTNSATPIAEQPDQPAPFEAPQDPTAPMSQRSTFSSSDERVSLIELEPAEPLTASVIPINAPSIKKYPQPPKRTKHKHKHRHRPCGRLYYSDENIFATGASLEGNDQCSNGPARVESVENVSVTIRTPETSDTELQKDETRPTIVEINFINDSMDKETENITIQSITTAIPAPETDNRADASNLEDTPKVISPSEPPPPPPLPPKPAKREKLVVDVSTATESMAEADHAHFYQTPSSPEDSSLRPQWPVMIARHGRKLTPQTSTEKEDEPELYTSRKYHLFSRGDSFSEADSDPGEKRSISPAAIKDGRLSPLPYSGHEMSDSDSRSTTPRSRHYSSSVPYSKRPLRGPYLEMIVNEQKKPENLKNAALNKLLDSRGGWILPNSSDRAVDDYYLRRSNTSPPSSSQKLNVASSMSSVASSTSPVSSLPKRKISANIPFCGSTSLRTPAEEKTLVHHQRTTSSPSQLEYYPDQLSTHSHSCPVPNQQLLHQLLRGSSEHSLIQDVDLLKKMYPAPTYKDTRSHIVVELYDTERSYVESLQILVTIPTMSDQQNKSTPRDDSTPTSGGDGATRARTEQTAGSSTALMDVVPEGNGNPPTPPEVTSNVSDADVRAALADPAVVEMIRKQKEEASLRKRRAAADRFQADVKAACCYSIPWAVAVMEHSVAFLRGLPGVVMPTVELRNEDLVFRQTDQDLMKELNKPSTSKAVGTSQSSQPQGKKIEWKFVMPKKHPPLKLIPIKDEVPEGWNILDPGIHEHVHQLKRAARAKQQEVVTVEDGVNDEPLRVGLVNEDIHRQEPSWDEEVEAAARRHRQPSPARSNASVQTVIDTKYLQPLKSPECSNLIDTYVVEEIFYKIPEILAYHEIFLEELRIRLEGWNKSKCIGDIFLETFTKPAVIDSYIAFINNRKTANESIKQITQTKPAFVRFIDAMAREHKGKLTLDSLLIMPVQRIPRYELLIQSLLKHTEICHPDYDKLQEALRQIHELALRINCTERDSLELEQIENLIDGLANLVTGDRTFLRYDLVSMTSGQGPSRKERALFLFNDLLIITSVKRRSSTVKKAVLSSPASITSSLEANKYKLLMKIPLEHLDIVKVKDENLRRMMREMEYLTDDVNTLSQMVDLVATLHCPHGQIEENIREMLGALNKQLNDRHVSESQLSYLELALNTRNSIENISVIFPKPEKRTNWEETFLEAKARLNVSGDRRLSPEFLTSVPIRKTRAGLQFTCAAASYNQQDVWVCNSDGYVGQVCILSLNPEPAVTSCNGVCNARILSVTSVPVSRYIEKCQGSLENLDSVSNTTSSSLPKSEPFEEVNESIPVEHLERNVSDICLDSSSSSDEDDEDEPIEEQKSAESPSLESVDSTMWLGTEDGVVHIYNCADSLRIKRNRLKIQHNSAVYCIFYVDKSVFVSLANGEVYMYNWCASLGWNTTDPIVILVGCVTTPVSRMFLVCGKLWCICHNIIKTLNIHTLQIENSFTIMGENNRAITSVAVSGFSVYLSLQNSAVLRVIHGISCEILAEVNIAPAVTKMLSGVDDIIRQHKAACLRVTSLLACKELLWIGTSAGVILTMPLPTVKQDTAKIASISPPIGLPHGHTGHVRFLTAVKYKSKKKDTTIRRSSKVLERKPDLSNVNKMLIISGGDGYEDFRSSSVSEIAGREDSTNHLLIWRF